MLKFLNKKYQNYLNIDQPKYEGLIVARQIWMVKTVFWLGGSVHLFYVFKNLFTILFY